MSTSDLDTDEVQVDEACLEGRRSTRRLSRLLIGGSLATVLAVVAVVAVLLRPAGNSTEAVPTQDSVDAGFARDMAIHHQQAVELSFIVRDRTGDEDVRRLAYDVINTQANQRGMLLGWLDVWGLPKSSQEPPMSWMGHDMSGMKGMAGMNGMDYMPHDGSLMPGMATNTQMDQLRNATGKTAEILYLRLLTAHHMGGIAMSEAAAEMAKTEQVRRLAQGMVDSQRAEIKVMADMLKQRGATA
ncbi:DUF305 domain-containing protein [Streptomyces sp. CA-106131]|uniref:DUF305 domain-containing protein n=1 Tax=Streptomyces sp. CA-106131 TaxID=3240045 RepID=UPI003D89EB8C